MKTWAAAGLAVAMLWGSFGTAAVAQIPAASAKVAEEGQPLEQTVKNIGGGSGHWADEALAKWKEAQVLTGYEDGGLQPDRLISRAELAALLQRIFGLQQQGGFSSFADVGQDDWYTGAVAAAKRTGIINGYGDGTFRPDETVSREDAAVMLARAFRLVAASGGGTAPLGFTDAGELAAYSRDIVGTLVSAGILSGYEDGSFRPGQGISRGETAELLSRIGGTLYYKAGDYDTEESLKNAVVNTGGVVLRNKKLAGNLYMAEGIGKGGAALESSRVEGTLFLQGGGQGIRLAESDISRIVLDASPYPARLVLDRGTAVQQIELDHPATVELSETARAVELKLGKNATGTVISGNGKIAKVTVAEEGITVNGQPLKPDEQWAWSGSAGLEKPAAGGAGNSSSGSGGTGGSGGGENSSWLPVVGQGVIPGTVKLSAPLADGHQLAVRISHTPVQAPAQGALLSKDSLTVYPYLSGTDISGADATVNRYLGVYEVDGKGSITRFREVALVASDIKPSVWNEVWQDEFDGSAIDTSKWNFVQGAGGYGNNELQNYTNRPDNARVEDGKLVIEAKEDHYQGTRYSSAKLTTEGKGDWTYGKYEIRAKMPAGRGIWPAIWMMPTDQKLYSAWPTSGEIDIMELLGHDPGKIYGTLHFGSPHQQAQGSYTLPDNASFADDFHTYGIEWEPGEVRYYIDGVLYTKLNDWFSKSPQEGEKYTYPAPFDRDFFLQLNVAVGGDWPGNPDAATVFPQKMLVDYVRVYEREGGVYRAPVLPPPPVVRGPEADGNYVANGEFNGALSPWVFQPFAPPEDMFGGAGTVKLDNGALMTTIEQEGRETYAVQVVQAGLPIVKDAAYKLSFDAWSSGSRTMDVGISGPDRGYVRYMQDKSVSLTDQPQTFQFTFTSGADTDTNGRLEFNMGKAGISPVYLDHIRLIKLSGPDPEQQQAPLPDGNLVYNGTFDQGTVRMGFWSVVGSGAATAQASVGSALTERKLAIRPEAPGQPGTLLLEQGHLSLSAGKLYLLTFDANMSAEEASIGVAVGTTAQPDRYTDQTVSVHTGEHTYSLLFTAGSEADHSAGLLQFKLGSLNQTLRLDNVALKEMKPPVAVTGMSRLEAENYSGMQGVQTGEDGLSVGWIDPGDWMQYIIDVKQAGDYTLTYFVASGYEGGGTLTLLTKQGSVFTKDLRAGEIARADADQVYEMNVGNTGDWGKFVLVSQEIRLEPGIQTIQLYAPHLNVDYMVLAAKNQSASSANLIHNGSFDADVGGWSTYQSDKLAISMEAGAMKVDLPVLTPEPWNQQVYQDGLPLVQGQIYTVSFDAYSTVNRPIEMGIGFIDADRGYQYTDFLNGSKPVFWLTGEKQQYQYSFLMDNASQMNSKLEFDLGQITVGEAVYGTPGIIYLDNLRLQASLVGNGLFHTDTEGWSGYWGDQWNGPSSGQLSWVDGQMQIAVDTTGSQNWNPQISREGIRLEAGKTYRLSFDAKAGADRRINIGLGRKLQADPWYIGYFGTDAELTTQMKTFSYTFTMGSQGEENGRLDFNVGQFEAGSAAPSTITLDNIVLVEVE